VRRHCSSSSSSSRRSSSTRTHAHNSTPPPSTTHPQPPLSTHHQVAAAEAKERIACEEAAAAKAAAAKAAEGAAALKTSVAELTEAAKAAEEVRVRLEGEVEEVKAALETAVEEKAAAVAKAAAEAKEAEVEAERARVALEASLSLAKNESQVAMKEARRAQLQLEEASRASEKEMAIASEKIMDAEDKLKDLGKEMKALKVELDQEAMMAKTAVKAFEERETEWRERFKIVEGNSQKSRRLARAMHIALVRCARAPLSHTLCVCCSAAAGEKEAEESRAELAAARLEDLEESSERALRAAGRRSAMNAIERLRIVHGVLSMQSNRLAGAARLLPTWAQPWIPLSTSSYRSHAATSSLRATLSLIDMAAVDAFASSSSFSSAEAVVVEPADGYTCTYGTPEGCRAIVRALMDEKRPALMQEEPVTSVAATTEEEVVVAASEAVETAAEAEAAAEAAVEEAVEAAAAMEAAAEGVEATTPPTPSVSPDATPSSPQQALTTFEQTLFPPTGAGSHHGSAAVAAEPPMMLTPHFDATHFTLPLVPAAGAGLASEADTGALAAIDASLVSSASAGGGGYDDEDVANAPSTWPVSELSRRIACGDESGAYECLTADLQSLADAWRSLRRAVEERPETWRLSTAAAACIATASREHAELLECLHAASAAAAGGQGPIQKEDGVEGAGASAAPVLGNVGVALRVDGMLATLSRAGRLLD